VREGPVVADDKQAGGDAVVGPLDGRRPMADCSLGWVFPIGNRPSAISNPIAVVFRKEGNTLRRVSQIAAAFDMRFSWSRQSDFASRFLKRGR
jgi:hypothetical protein